MSELVTGLVLASALLHLTWNLLVRHEPGSLKFVWYLTLAGGLLATGAALVLGFSPDFHRVWPWLLGTIIAHALYFSGLAHAYNEGDLGDIYPATRGGGILGTVLLAGLLLQQPIPLVTLCGILLVALAVMVPAFRARWTLSRMSWTLLVMASIAVYSTTDSHGVHLLSPIPYIACQFLGTALVLTPWALKDRTAVRVHAAVGAGLMSMISYLLILSAYQRTTAAPVLALRQIGIALSPWMGWLFLRERMRRDALWISIAIAIGAALIVMG